MALAAIVEFFRLESEAVPQQEPRDMGGEEQVVEGGAEAVHKSSGVYEKPNYARKEKSVLKKKKKED